MLILLAALCWDLGFGEMPNKLHPVAWTGHVIAWMRRHLLRLRTARSQLLGGGILAFGLPLALASATYGVMADLEKWPVAHAVVAVFLLKSTFALRELGAAAQRVRAALERGDVAKGRYELRSLCSRDAQHLQPPALVSATIGSVAENISDSFIAPLFYFACFGLPGAVCYRVVNTLDAMIGYRGQYEYLGKSAARLDDLLNIIPARLSAGLLLLAGALWRLDVRRATRTLRADRKLTASPNGGWPMAAMAGLLGIQISKAGHYDLGQPLEPCDPGKIGESWRLALTASGLLGLAVGLLVCLSSWRPLWL